MKLRSGAEHNKYVRTWCKNRRKKYPWRGTYLSITQRCGWEKSRYYKRGIKCLITIAELKKLWFRDKAWLLKKPSIDRKDNNGDYIFSNCRYIELVENARLGNIGRKKKGI